MSHPHSRGVEVLVWKAAVDSAFRELLLAQRGEAAATLGLELTPAESQLLASIAPEQLAAVIDHTHVPEEHRRAFLGHAAAAMLAALGVAGTAWGGLPGSGGAFGNRPEPLMGGSGGLRADQPRKDIPGGIGGMTGDTPQPKSMERRVLVIARKWFPKYRGVLTRNTQWIEDLLSQPKQLAKVRTALEKEFKVKIPEDDFAHQKTVGQTADFIDKALGVPPQAKPGSNQQPDPPPVSLGIRPDLPR